MLPLRRIVVIRPHEWLEAGWRSRSFGPVNSEIRRRFKLKKFELDKKYYPVSLMGRLGLSIRPETAAGFNYRMLNEPVEGGPFILRAYFEDPSAQDAFQREHQDDVVGVFADPRISPFPAPYCGRAAVGDSRRVAQLLGVGALRKAMLTGKKVRVAVVDTGVNGLMVPVSGGWSPVPSYRPGSARPDHGTMVAYDARIAAPDAEILDYALLRSVAGTWQGFLSDAVAAFSDLLTLIQSKPGPLIVNNSWGMYNRTEDSPIGSPDNYSANPNHPFNQIVGTLVSAGADIFFAAGNCGDPCPSRRCGRKDRGPGASIHGANSHPDVISVAAVTVRHDRLGYSSQGPGALYRRKPDIATYSHFKGSGVFRVDSGTSAASPVAAGVAAALRQGFPNRAVEPSGLKGVLQRTAIDVGRRGWDYDFGYGIVNASNALMLLQAAAPKIRA